MATSIKSKKPTNEKEQFHIIRGLPCAAWFQKEVFEAIFDFMPQNGDVIIATYPKTGTTWMQYIVHQILTRGESFPTLNDMVDKVIPFLEISGVSAVEEITTNPRVYKHHFPYDKVQKNLYSKIIYVYRRPEDTLVSYYHFMGMMGFKVEFDQYFEDFLSGNVPYGRYLEHVLSYLKHIDDGNILMVSYEKLQFQIKDEILRIARFLGDDHYEVLVHDDLLITKITEHTSFNYMKQNLFLSFPGNKNNAFELENRIVPLFRKGIVGEGKKVLTDQQLSRLQEVVIEVMKDTDILEEWLNS